MYVYSVHTQTNYTLYTNNITDSQLSGQLEDLYILHSKNLLDKSDYL